MSERPSKYLNDFYKDKVKRDVDLLQYIHTQSDSFITWIIGFSFTGLLLLTSDLTKFSQSSASTPILICVTISIIVGIAFRYVSFLITMFQKSLDDYYIGFFSENLMTPTTLEEDIDKMNFEQLVELIKSDFDRDLPFTFPVPDDIKKAEEPELRKFYLLLVEHSKKEFDIALENLAESDEIAYKIKKEETIAAIKNGLKGNPKIGYNLRMWNKIRSYLYTVCLLSFIVAIITLFFAILTYLNT